VPYLFDTDAISELLRRKPDATYVDWVRTVPREDQFISAVSVGELYHGAYRSNARARHLTNIEERVLPAVTILPYDAATAKVFGRIRSDLEAARTRLDDADLQIAATACITTSRSSLGTYGTSHESRDCQSTAFSRSMGRFSPKQVGQARVPGLRFVVVTEQGMIVTGRRLHAIEEKEVPLALGEDEVFPIVQSDRVGCRCVMQGPIRGMIPTCQKHLPRFRQLDRRFAGGFVHRV
jgi:predicted nucleic acid-binding protein